MYGGVFSLLCPCFWCRTAPSWCGPPHQQGASDSSSLVISHARLSIHGTYYLSLLCMCLQIQAVQAGVGGKQGPVRVAGRCSTALLVGRSICHRVYRRVPYIVREVSQLKQDEMA